MNLLKTLLDNYIILKGENRDLYYDIKDSYKSFKSFVEEKLGYNLIIHQDFIKLEKFPGRVEPWMGIGDFKEKLDYCLLMLLLMFLEDKGKEEQFVLSSLIDYINGNFDLERIDWTIYSNRRSLIRVLKFAQNLKLIKVTDGQEQDFADSEGAEVLYENTGISKYIVRTFPVDISFAKNLEDLLNFAPDSVDEQRGIFRRHRVYRTLVLNPVMYNYGSEDQDFGYIKNYKSRIEEDLAKYLDWKLHVHREGALVVLDEGERIKDSFPNSTGISDIVLLLNKRLLELLKRGELVLAENSWICIDKEEFWEIIKRLKKDKDRGWSKEYREGKLDYLVSEILEFMKGFNMLEKTGDKIYVKPLIGKVMGDYPEDYLEKEE
ncbi:TIGR02678 family protein [Anaerobranca gottschalkii]|uniref:TIGR02678 family protein n=1 Tax=Anaerobranca gottschalkii DSM 13577 TaxID=1120990 RepID=A0A1H9ZHC4_9FIRM|nr:TIGR02678 family protein [Anaerobranca gottschalkii]SES80897.1 TIGR02678 family protein [Anaerobranca gottschalkii DSM 13577]